MPQTAGLGDKLSNGNIGCSWDGGKIVHLWWVFIVIDGCLRESIASSVFVFGVGTKHDSSI